MCVAEHGDELNGIILAQEKNVHNNESGHCFIKARAIS